MGVIRASVSQDKEHGPLLPASPAHRAPPAQGSQLPEPGQNSLPLLFCSYHCSWHTQNSSLNSKCLLGGPPRAPWGEAIAQGEDQNVGKKAEWVGPSQSSGLSQSLDSSPETAMALPLAPSAGRAQRGNEKHALQSHSRWVCILVLPCPSSGTQTTTSSPPCFRGLSFKLLL